MDQITVPAQKENLSRVLEFIGQELESFPYNPKALLRLELAVEEAFVNIASYAYQPDNGEITVGMGIDEEPLQVTVQLIDSGIRFNPLENEDPDVSTGIEQKQPGGLGIFLIKKNVDQVQYQYQEGKNMLTLHQRMD
jgi:serine/threonine-protein kinase RsbW